MGCLPCLSHVSHLDDCPLPGLLHCLFSVILDTTAAVIVLGMRSSPQNPPVLPMSQSKCQSDHNGSKVPSLSFLSDCISYSCPASSTAPATVASSCSLNTCLPCQTCPQPLGQILLGLCLTSGLGSCVKGSQDTPRFEDLLGGLIGLSI